MQIFGLSITRTKAAPPTATLAPVSGRGWWPIIRESFAGAWQRNVEIRVADVLSYSTLWSCVTLIAQDIGKLWLLLVERDEDGILTETESAAFSPVLRKPNRYQTRNKFIEQWIYSLLLHGNTYVLKQRDQRGVVVADYILDPQRVTVLVAPDGSVFYQISKDNLSGVAEDLVVPAREIIHDRINTVYHPLIGISPIHACGLAALQGLKIQQNSEQFFANQSQPGGILMAPTPISPETAERLERAWNTNFSGPNAGRIAVVGDGMTYQPMSISARDAQLIDQLRLSSEMVCSCFHVPPYKVGVGPMPTYNNIQALNTEYYGQALQSLIENIESLLKEGHELPNPFEVKFDLDALLRMDTATLTASVKDAIAGGFMTPNEGRKKFDLKPVEGGDTPYLQQQQFSLAALNRRDQAALPPPTDPMMPVKFLLAMNQPAEPDNHTLREKSIDQLAAELMPIIVQKAAAEHFYGA